MGNSKLIKIVKAKKWIPAYYRKVKGRRVHVRGHYTTIKKRELDKEEFKKSLVTSTILLGMTVYTAELIRTVLNELEKEKQQKNKKSDEK